MHRNLYSGPRLPLRTAKVAEFHYNFVGPGTAALPGNGAHEGWNELAAKGRVKLPTFRIESAFA
jgi:hypothetical protein